MSKYDTNKIVEVLLKGNGFYVVPNLFSKKDVKNTSFFSVSRDKKVTPFTWLPHTWRDLRKVRDELEAELDKFGYKDKDLILYRSIKSGFGNWDVISVFSEKRVPVGN